MPSRRLHTALEQVLGQPEQGPSVLEIADKQCLDNRTFGRLDLHPRGVPGPIGMQAIAIGRNGPGQEKTGLEFHLAPSSHAVRNEGPVVFGHGSPDLDQEMILGVLPQRLIEELYPAASLFEFFSQYHLMDIVPGQPIWTGEHDPVKRGLFDPIPQAIQPWPIERGAPIPIITENVLRP